MALRVGSGGPRAEARRVGRLPELVTARAAFRCAAADARGVSPGDEQLTQNWYGQGESDCLIKTKQADLSETDLDSL